MRTSICYLQRNTKSETSQGAGFGGQAARGPDHPPKKILGCAARQSSLEEQLSALAVDHGHLLRACVKIASYN